MPAEGDKKVFKLIITQVGQPEKTERFYAANVCSKACWIKKLLQAKNGSFQSNDCQGVPMDEMLAL